MSSLSAWSTDVSGQAAHRIGPNAVLQLIETLHAHDEDALAGDVFRRAGAGAWLLAPPAEMIGQESVARVHGALWDLVPIDVARERAREAGLRTGDYILAHRIPKPAQRLLKLMPAPIAARMLCKAISAHAWTFAGSGEFDYAFEDVLRLRITANPLALRHSPQPDCVWHVAVFERLFSRLVHPDTHVIEVACTALGDPACVFEVRFGRS